jgi:hypothetical protein
MRPGKLAMGLTAGTVAVLAFGGAWALMGSGDAAPVHRGEQPGAVRVRERHSLPPQGRVHVVERDPETRLAAAERAAALQKRQERRRRARKKREEERLQREQQEAAARQAELDAAAEAPRADEIPPVTLTTEPARTADTGERPAVLTATVDAGRTPRAPGREDPPANPPLKPATSAPGAAAETVRPTAAPGTATTPP